MAKYYNTYHCYGLAIKDDVSTERLYRGIHLLLLFNVVFLVMHTAYSHITPFFSRDVS